MGVTPILLYFDNHINLHRDIERQRGGTHGGAGVDAFVTEDFYQKVGAAVDNGGVLIEVRLGVNESADVDDARDFIEGANFVLDHGEAVQGDDAGGFLGGFQRGFGRNLAEIGVVIEWGDTAGEEEEVTGADAIDVGAGGCGSFGKGVAEFLDVGFDGHGSGLEKY